MPRLRSHSAQDKPSTPDCPIHPATQTLPKTARCYMRLHTSDVPGVKKGGRVGGAWGRSAAKEIPWGFELLILVPYTQTHGRRERLQNSRLELQQGVTTSHSLDWRDLRLASRGASLHVGRLRHRLTTSNHYLLISVYPGSR